MAKNRVQANKVVSITYRIVDQDGQMLEIIDLPVSYVHGGEGRLFEKIEAALEGRGVGESVEVHISPEEGFGHHDPSLTYTDDLENVPPQFRHVGAEVEMQSEQGDVRRFMVTRIADGKLTVDGNHPLAGKSVTFIVKVTAIRDATPQEIETGTPEDYVLH